MINGKSSPRTDIVRLFGVCFQEVAYALYTLTISVLQIEVTRAKVKCERHSLIS